MADQFSSGDVDIVVDNDNDPIVVSIIIGNYQVHRVLIDDGSTVEILSYDVFRKMGLDDSSLKLATSFMIFSTSPSKLKVLLPY